MIVSPGAGCTLPLCAGRRHTILAAARRLQGQPTSLSPFAPGHTARTASAPWRPSQPASRRRGVFPSLELGLCQCVAVFLAEFPTDMHESLRPRVHERDATREMRFDLSHGPRVLSVVHEGKLQLVRWGSEREDRTEPPCTAWTWLSSLDAGKWDEWSAEAVTVPATWAWTYGVWYRVRALLARDEQGQFVAYLLVQPADAHFLCMTHSDRMPVPAGDRQPLRAFDPHCMSPRPG